jgi:DNA-binding NarL/FixJ family response regulator
MTRSELADQCILLNELLSLRELVKRSKHQPKRTAAGLEAFRRAVAQALSSALSPPQTSALVNLQKALARDDDPVVLWRDYSDAIDQRVESVRELAADNEVLQRVLQTEHHDWRNALTLLVKWQQVEDAMRRCAEWLGRPGTNADLPDLGRLQSLLETERSSEEVVAGLTTYFGEHGEELVALSREARGNLARWDRTAVPKSRQKAQKIRHVLLVEDEDGWREDVEHVAWSVAATVEGVSVSAVGHCTAARRFVAEHADEGVLTVCDIGLPADEEQAARGEWHEDNGWSLIEDLSKQCRVIALTSFSRLDRDFLRIEGQTDDFLLKESQAWASDLRQRLGTWLRPLSPRDLEVIVPAFNAEWVLVGGVWVRLKPYGFAVVDALAFGWQETPEEFFRRLPRYDGAAAPPRPVNRTPLDLDQLKTVMCRREITDLKPDFMDDFEVKQLRDQVRFISPAVAEAFGKQGLAIEAGEFLIENEQGCWRLAGPARVCDTPAAFHSSTQTLRGPLRVLVVEDEEQWRETVVTTLERLPDAAVDVATSYEEALEKASARPPHLVSLDLNIPKDGIAKPEHGVRLRKELTRAPGGMGFVVFTSHDRPALRRELSRILGPETVEAAGGDVYSTLCRRVDARAILLKQEGETARAELLVHAWRLQQERRTGGALTFQPGPLHEVEVNLAEWGLKVNGIEVPNTARGENKVRDHALLCALALCAPWPMRRQALVDYWDARGLLRNERKGKDLKDPGQQLTDRVKYLRKTIEDACGIEGEKVLQTAGRDDPDKKGVGDGYALAGNVAVNQ